MALLVGWLVNRIESERRRAERRAEEAEALRDELGRRADLLDAANRCARALSSSLDLDEASGAFVRELRGVAAVRPHGDRARGGGCRARDRGRRRARRRRDAGGHGADARAQPARRGPRPWPDDRAPRHGGAGIRRGADARRARPALTRRGAAALRRADDRPDLARAARAGRVHGRRGRARRLARPPRRVRGRRTSARTTASAGPSRSCGDSPRCAPTSSRSSRTSCAARWRR